MSSYSSPLGFVISIQSTLTASHVSDKETYTRAVGDSAKGYVYLSYGRRSSPPLGRDSSGICLLTYNTSPLAKITRDTVAEHTLPAESTRPTLRNAPIRDQHIRLRTRPPVLLIRGYRLGRWVTPRKNVSTYPCYFRHETMISTLLNHFGSSPGLEYFLSPPVPPSISWRGPESGPLIHAKISRTPRMILGHIGPGLPAPALMHPSRGKPSRAQPSRAEPVKLEQL